MNNAVAASIIGVVKLGHTNQVGGYENREKECICCPDFPSHIYKTELVLPSYPSAHMGRNVDLWLRSVFEYKKLEGRKIRITAEVLDENNDETPEATVAS